MIKSYIEHEFCQHKQHYIIIIVTNFFLRTVDQLKTYLINNEQRISAKNTSTKYRVKLAVRFELAF